MEQKRNNNANGGDSCNNVRVKKEIATSATSEDSETIDLATFDYDLTTTPSTTNSNRSAASNAQSSAGATDYDLLLQSENPTIDLCESSVSSNQENYDENAAAEAGSENDSLTCTVQGIPIVDLCDSPASSSHNSEDIDEGEGGAAGAAEVQETLECPICLQPCVHPARLNCGHIFCFLCIKGVAYKNKRCAMCRREISDDYMNHPDLINGPRDLRATRAHDDGYQWFYEGRNGWWQYDDRTSQDIEEAYKKGEKSCTILVAGYVYIVDLETLLQQRQNDPTRCRRVKRDLATIPKKGVAGLRIEGNTVITDANFANSMQQSRQQQHHPHHDHHQQQLDQSSSSNSMTTTMSMSSSINQNANDLTRNFHLPFDYGMRLPSNTISPIAATDAAIRIASDIIDSTLAHADEVTRNDFDVTFMANTLGDRLANAVGDITASTTTTTAIPTSISNTNISGEHGFIISTTTTSATTTTPLLSSSTTTASQPTTTTNRPISITSSSSTSNPQTLCILSNAFSSLTLDSLQSLIPDTTNDSNDTNLIEQTLNEFHMHNMGNRIDSSDEEDDVTACITHRRM